MYGETLDFQCQVSNGNVKYPIGKSIFSVNLPLKLFPATDANADIGNLKSLHIFLWKWLYHILVKSEQNWMAQTTRNFELFDKKKPRVFYNHFWQSVDACLEDVSVAETIV